MVILAVYIAQMVFQIDSLTNYGEWEQDNDDNDDDNDDN